MMIEEVQPESCMEWLWTLDLVELSWEILRYRRLKMRILALDRSAAIEAIILRIDGEGLPLEAMSMLRQHARRAAADWRTDPRAAVDIEAHLERSGFGQIDIDAQVIAQAREVFEMFDHLMQSAQSRRVALLREICVPREFCEARSRNCENVRLRKPKRTVIRTHPSLLVSAEVPRPLCAPRSADQAYDRKRSGNPLLHPCRLGPSGGPRDSRSRNRVPPVKRAEHIALLRSEIADRSALRVCHTRLSIALRRGSRGYFSLIP
jgi:hypothetical protein